FCGLLPGRRAGVAQVFLTNVDDAIAEVRWAREAGLMGVLIPADHSMQMVSLYERRLDPFWAACTELGMPVHRHSTFVGPPETPDTGPATGPIGMYDGLQFLKRGMSHLTLGGVFHRHPDLKFLFTETSTTWVPTELLQLDAMYSSALVEGS